MPDHLIVWLAGFLEGEGSFICSESRSTIKGKEYSYPRLTLQFVSTDYDVAAKACDLMDTNCNPTKIPYRGIKIPYRGAISNEKAFDLMKELFPLMGKRRKIQIAESIAKWKNADPQLIYDLLDPERRAGAIQKIKAYTPDKE